MSYPNVVQLFKELPAIGWGASIEFDNSYEHWLKCWTILSGLANTTIITSRATYLYECEKNKDEELEFKKWVLIHLCKTNIYIDFLIQDSNFIYANGDFYLQEFSKDTLERLAEQYLKYVSNIN